jgi:hypothetical protein
MLLKCQRTSRIAVCVSVALLNSLALNGCSRTPPLDPEVPTEKRILMLVDDVDDFSQSAKELERIKRLFAPGSEPSKEALARYSMFRYEAKLCVPSTDSATVTVIAKDAKSGETAGEVQWSVIKVHDVWKLKDAPLPAVASQSPHK